MVLEQSMAARREPSPLSLVLVTTVTQAVAAALAVIDAVNLVVVLFGALPRSGRDGNVTINLGRPKIARCR